MDKYNRADKFSILEYSRGILNQSLEDAISPETIDKAFKGKGRLGQMVEKFYFKYDPNSKSEADFSEAGVELKCTPLKELKNHKLQIKERLVCSNIDYSKDYRYDFRSSQVYRKCTLMLILFYLHKSSISVTKLKFLYSVLWKLPEKDLLIMEQDYEKIRQKIREGRAHEISEGDTVYLGACRRGKKGDVNKVYIKEDGSVADKPAPKRAYSLKPSYMRIVLRFAQDTGGYGTCNFGESSSGLVDTVDLKNKSFEEILIARFHSYYGKSENELFDSFSLTISPSAKNRYAIIANAILTEGYTRGKNYKKSEEFVKSGIMLKTIRIEESGRIKQAMSFENIVYGDVYKEKNWYSSRLYELFTSRFMFIVFRQNPADKEYVLVKAFFWTMPYQDLQDAAAYWANIKDNIMSNRIDSRYFYKQSDHKKFHVRPKGRNSLNMTDNPNGGLARKYCYWFNKDYVENIVDNN